MLQVKVTNSKTFQNQIFPEFRYRQKTFQFQEIHTYDYNEIAELRKTRVAKKRNRAVLREMTFANDCANCFFFGAKLMRNERKILRFVPQKLRKSFANGKPTYNLVHRDCVFWRLIVFQLFYENVCFEWTKRILKVVLTSYGK